VDERVVVPRSFIAELLRDRLRPWISQPIHRALDLCTGSGCLAILLALAFPRARIDATDISRAALAVARKNVRAYRLGRRVKLARADLFSGIGRHRYDLIVANPPYVGAAAMRKLPPEYRREPRIALAGARTAWRSCAASWIARPNFSGREDGSLWKSGTTAAAWSARSANPLHLGGSERRRRLRVPPLARGPIQ